MKPDAYTVGNPVAYEQYFDEDPNPRKAIGGIVYLTREEAEDVVKDGILPPEWFDGKILPGKVYGLLCDPDSDVQDFDGELCLTVPADLVRV